MLKKKIRAVHVPYLSKFQLEKLKGDAELKLSDFHAKWSDSFISETDEIAVWEHYQKKMYNEKYGDNGPIYFHWWRLANLYDKPWVEYVSRGGAQRLREMSALGILTVRRHEQSYEDMNRNGFRVLIELKS